MSEAQIRQTATGAQIGDRGLQPGISVHLQTQPEAVLARPAGRIQGQGGRGIRPRLMAEVALLLPLEGGHPIHLDHAEATFG